MNNKSQLLPFKHAKHIFNRGMFTTEHIESGLIHQQYTCTDDMIGDLGTKVHGKARLDQLCKLIHLGIYNNQIG